MRRSWSAAALPLALCAIAAGYLGSLGFGFLADARFLIAENHYLDGWRWLWPNLSHDYFWSSSGEAVPYWRPLTKASWLVEAQLFGRSELAFHAVQIGWLLIAAAGVYALARRLGASPAWAGAAAALFGLHPSLVEPACLIMARSDVTVTACTLWAVVAWHAWVSAQSPSRLVAAGHVLACVLAFASKESAIVLPAVLTAWALAMGLRGRRLLTLAPSWLLAALYFVARSRVVGTLPTVTPDPIGVFVGLAEYGWALLPFRLSSALRNLSLVEAHAAPTVALAAAVWAALVAGAIVAWRRRSTAAIGLLLLGVASLLPVLVGPAPFVPGALNNLSLADRWLATGAAAMSIGVALACGHLPARVARLAGVAIVLWCVAALALTPRLHAYYQSEITLLDLEDRVYEETPAKYHTLEDDCRASSRGIIHALAGNAPDAAVALWQARPALCPLDGSAEFNLLSALVMAERYPEARQIGEALLTHFTLPNQNHAEALFLVATALLHTGDPARAEAMFLEALRRGIGTCSVFRDLGGAAAAQGHDADAAAYRQRYAECAAAATP